MCKLIRIRWDDGDVSYYRATSISAAFSALAKMDAVVGQIIEAKVLRRLPKGIDDSQILDLEASV